MNSHTRLPTWLKKKSSCDDSLHLIKKKLRSGSLCTVCEEARCPNIGECFGRSTATFMIMGDTCTRSCGFCSVKNGTPKPLDPDEPQNVAKMVSELGLKHAVITSVTRDDLPDGGAAHFVRTIEAIRKICPTVTIEVLTPDFEGREHDIQIVCEARPDVFNHNIETVERLTPQVRNKAQYRRSLAVIRIAKEKLSSPSALACPRVLESGVGDPFELERFPTKALGNDNLLVKSGLMVGLGETPQEVLKTLADLANTGCGIVTIGQYLRPSKNAIPVKEYVEPDVFKYYEMEGLKLGLKRVFSGPFVRSSYKAGVRG